MIIFPAIDLVDGEAVRLYKGDFAKKTVYSKEPVSVAKEFARQGATHIHLVDLDGARRGDARNFDLICRIKEETGLFVEVGGGVRTAEMIERYLERGIDRVILGTVAVTDPDFIKNLSPAAKAKVAVGVDVKEGKVAIKGWTETTDLTLADFCKQMQEEGVKTVICTDIGRDGAMRGTNGEMYRRLSEEISMNIVASGGVSSIEDVRMLREMGLYGAIIGKAYYEGAIDLGQAIEVAR